MEIVELREGEILRVIWPSAAFECSTQITYDELARLLQYKSRKKTRKLSAASKFSRIAQLSSRAIITGVWTSGQNIDENEVFSKLIKAFNLLSMSDYRGITDKALTALFTLQTERERLGFTAAQVDVLTAMIHTICKEREVRV
jgi:hypothetical protein